jgi:sugar/nucleoside kinase (ribokinase family)
VDSLKQKGVRSEPVLLPKVSTALDLILNAKGQDRRFHVDPGANIMMSADAVIALIKKYRPRLFYAGGVGFLNRLDARLDGVLKLARRLGARTFVDVVSPYRQTWAFLRRALPYVDFFHCNSDEAVAITGERTPRLAIEKIRRLGPTYTFLTMGIQGGLACLPGATLRLPAFSVQAKDQTGAGDAFSAALLLKIDHALESGDGPERMSIEDWKAILLYASACGAVCCTGLGATTSVTEDKVASLIRRQGRAFARAITTLR